MYPSNTLSKNFKEQTLYQKVLELTQLVRIEIQNNPLLLVCMAGSAITRLLSVLFSTYLILWIQTFVNGDNGSAKLLESKEEGKTIY